MGDDLACEAVARALGAAGVGHLRLIRRTGALPLAVAQAMSASNPELQIATWPWPRARSGAASVDDPADRRSPWLDAIAGAAVVVRAGFDDDPMLRAAVQMAVPVVAMRGREDGIDVISFRRHGPCPHLSLDIPAGPETPSEDGAPAIVAAHIAAAEALALIAEATAGDARARLIRIPAPGVSDGGSAAPGGAGWAVRSTDIPWAPECFACGGSGVEMSFA